MQNKIKSYGIVRSNTATALADNVVSVIVKGWFPQGGIAVLVHSDGRQEFYQAIVQYHEEF